MHACNGTKFAILSTCMYSRNSLDMWLQECLYSETVQHIHVHVHTHSLDINSLNDVYSGKYESNPLEAVTVMYSSPMSPSPVNYTIHAHYNCIKCIDYY